MVRGLKHDTDLISSTSTRTPFTANLNSDLMELKNFGNKKPRGIRADAYPPLLIDEVRLIQIHASE